MTTELLRSKDGMSKYSCSGFNTYDAVPIGLCTKMFLLDIYSISTRTNNEAFSDCF